MDEPREFLADSWRSRWSPPVAIAMALLLVFFVLCFADRSTGDWITVGLGVQTLVILASQTFNRKRPVITISEGRILHRSTAHIWRKRSVILDEVESYAPKWGRVAFQTRQGKKVVMWLGDFSAATRVAVIAAIERCLPGRASP